MPTHTHTSAPTAMAAINHLLRVKYNIMPWKICTELPQFCNHCKHQNRKANKANTDVEASTGHLSNMVAMSVSERTHAYWYDRAVN